jgi:hypothetical protein
MNSFLLPACIIEGDKPLVLFYFPEFVGSITIFVFLDKEQAR